MPKLFISYRRTDSRKDVGRIYDRLVEALGKDNVFKDVDSIPLGTDFRAVLRKAVAKCDVQLVIIGKSWLASADENGARRLDNPDDFVRIEIETALQRKKCVVIPVLVDNATMPDSDDLPDSLRELAFKNATIVRDDPDFHNDMTKIIRELGEVPANVAKTPARTFDVHGAISRFYQHFEEQKWDEARALLKEIRASGKAPRVFNIDAHEAEIQAALDTEGRDQEYGVLRLMAQRKNTSGVWNALQAFWQSYPGYDPDNLARFKPAPPPSSLAVVKAPPPVRVRKPTSTDLLPAPFAWIDIPDGKGKKWTGTPYRIARYPVTNAQFRLFVEAGGYRDPKWWTSSGWALREKEKWTEPRLWNDGKWNGAEQPVVGVSWYEAVAFCLWLGDTAGEIIMLPTEDQWQYAAQGDAGRAYPWGNDWDKNRCNHNVGNSFGAIVKVFNGKTTSVRQYEGKGDSPFGAVDMAGNVWDWCLTGSDNTNNLNSSAEKRSLRGGSWFSDEEAHFRCDFRGWNTPQLRDTSFGFRLVRT